MSPGPAAATIPVATTPEPAVEPTATHHPDEDALADLALGRVTDPARLTDLERHLAGCPDCRQRVSRVAGPPTASGVSAPPLPPEPDPDLQIDPDLFADYRLLRSLGRGGMGEVFLAKNLRLDRHEAIKIIHPGYVTHPGAVERFQARGPQRRPVPGPAHRHRVRLPAGRCHGRLRHGARPRADPGGRGQGQGPAAGATRVSLRPAGGPGLQRAHEKGMVHRDIKPGNLILRKDGARHLVKILDFGLSKVTAEVPADGELTGAGRAMGTPAYAAPEQALDAAAADTRSDIYSLGGTLFFLLTGRAPFAGTSAIDLWRAHVETPPPSVTELRPDVPAELAAIIDRMLAKSPAERYQTPAEAAAALVPFIKAPAKDTAGPPPLPPPVPRDETQSTIGRPILTTATERPAPRATAELPPLPARRPPWGLIGAGAAGVVVLATVVGLWAAGVFKPKAPDDRGGPPDARPAAGVASEPGAGGPEPDGFVPLFNGVDTAGWVHMNKWGRWTVQDGTLYGVGDGQGRWTTLATVRDTFDDFVLEMRAVHSDHAIAALYVRFKAMAGGVRGYRIALGGLEGKGKKPVTAGSMRREMPYEKEAAGKYDAKAPKGPLRRNELFTLRVTVTGNRVVTEINGQGRRSSRTGRGNCRRARSPCG